MKLVIGLIVLLISMISGKIIIDKMEVQIDPKYAEVKHSIKDNSKIFVDAVAKADSDDVVIEAAVYSKIDGAYSPFVKPDPIHVCKIHENEDPLIKFMHDEVIKFGNVTKACPVIKNTHYYLHDFGIEETDFPMPLPAGEFRVDVNASVVVGGNMHHVCSTEVFFKIVR